MTWLILSTHAYKYLEHQCLKFNQQSINNIFALIFTEPTVYPAHIFKIFEKKKRIRQQKEIWSNLGKYKFINYTIYGKKFF